LVKTKEKEFEECKEFKNTVRKHARTVNVNGEPRVKGEK
jgi:hypothetical protein